MTKPKCWLCGVELLIDDVDGHVGKWHLEWSRRGQHVLCWCGKWIKFRGWPIHCKKQNGGVAQHFLACQLNGERK